MEKYNKYILILIVVTVLVMSIGYSVLNRELNISGEVNYRPQADVRITDIIQEGFSNATIQYADFSKNEIKLAYTPLTLSEITYKVEITNFSNDSVGIFKIDGLDEANATISGYELKQTLSNVDGPLKAGESTIITITFTPKNLETKTVLLNFDFRLIHTITYIDLDDENYPKEIIDGDNLVVNFDKQVEIQYVKVIVGGAKRTFETNGNTITVNNITGNVVIRYKTLSEYVMEIADSKKCMYNGDYYSVTSTDDRCQTVDADDPPYHTYFYGTNDCIDFNYVWYSGYMWRITEVLNDGSVKMISENVLSAINFGQDPYFDNSYIKQWLNEDFLDTLYNHDKILVTDASWDISPWYYWCWIDPPLRSTSTVGLLNPYEWSKTAVYGSQSYLNIGYSFWLSSYNGVTDNPTTVATVIADGSYSSVIVPNSAFGVRPMVVLKEDVKFSGTGTKDDPFVLLDDIKEAQAGDPINKRTPGELVKINNILYRILNIHEQDGKMVTKLKSAEYVKDDKGNVMLKQFGSMQGMPTYKEVVESGNEEYWGAYLNNEWLENQGIERYLVQDTYYLDPAQNSTTDGSIIGSYKNTTCAEKNTSETTKKCVKTDKTWKGYVGLPIVGELFAYPLGGNDTHDYKTATMTPYGDSSYPMIGAFEPETQGVFQETYDQDFAVKPTITLKEDVIIKSGDGKTPQTAYEIELPVS